MTVRQTRLEWKRAQRMRWIVAGFEIARKQSADLCTDLSETVDERSEQSRALGVKAKESVRRLRQVAHLIRTMPRPETLAKHADADVGVEP